MRGVEVVGVEEHPVSRGEAFAAGREILRPPAYVVPQAGAEIVRLARLRCTPDQRRDRVDQALQRLLAALAGGLRALSSSMSKPTPCQPVMRPAVSREAIATTRCQR